VYLTTGTADCSHTPVCHVMLAVTIPDLKFVISTLSDCTLIGLGGSGDRWDTWEQWAKATEQKEICVFLKWRL